ncbi:hypothetical protein F5Y02DRAFT_16051 [Annulohypoxylon stygium]|nr:hypothetical protein F5Y02DRAFT_16051 [Annulohypoxylon stygium]
MPIEVVLPKYKYLITASLRRLPGLCVLSQMHSTKEVTLEFGMELAPDHSIPEVVPPQHAQYKGYDISQWQDGVYQEKRIAGLRRETFWLLVCLFAVVALALGLGTGLGLGLRGNNVNTTGKDAESASISNGNSISSAIATSTPAAESVAAESVPTTTSTSSTSSTMTTSIAQSTITSLVNSGCPGINGTTTSMSTNGVNMTYRFYCDSDLTGTDQASLVTNSLDECVRLCDSLNWTENRRDVGAVWNEKGVVGQKAGTCWCKGGKGIQVISHTGIVVASAVS